MRDFSFRFPFWLCTLAWAGGWLPTLAVASMPREDYLAALKIADQYVQRRKDVAGGAGALSTAIAYSLLGKYYEVGDNWKVAAVHVDAPQMRMTSDPDQLRSPKGRVGIFSYRVTEVRPGENPQVAITVRQQAEFGTSIIDPKLESVLLVTNDRLNQAEKTYRFGTRPGQPVSPEGVRIPNVSPLELFPIDVPDAQTAVRQDSPRADVLPELPEGLREIAAQTGWKPDLAHATWFEQDDFFGRPVRFLWVKGDPWPVYLKTAQGTAILIRKGANP